jgi:hypothetical protein
MSVRLKAPAPRGRGRARVVPQRPHGVGDWKVVALRLAGGAVVLWGLFSLIGMLVTHVLVRGPVQSADRGVEVWFAARRTGAWNSVTMFGNDMAETQTAIAVTVVVVLLLRWRLGRCYESWIMAGELLVFYSVTATVHRPRPPAPAPPEARANRRRSSYQCAPQPRSSACHDLHVLRPEDGGPRRRCPAFRRMVSA